MEWWRNTRGEWYVVAQAIVMALVAAGPWIDPAAWSGAPLASVAAGALLGAAGLAMACAGFVSLGRNLTPMPRPKDRATMVRSGAYAIVRHPIYAGIALAAFGWALAWRSPLTLVLAAALLAFFDLKSRREERWLVEAFPGYEDYRSQVKKLIPYIY